MKSGAGGPRKWRRPTERNEPKRAPSQEAERAREGKSSSRKKHGGGGERARELMRKRDEGRKTRGGRSAGYPIPWHRSRARLAKVGRNFLMYVAESAGRWLAFLLRPGRSCGS